MKLEEVIELLNPKVKELGLNKKEVEKAAQTIHSALAEDATNEDAEKAIDNALPYLEMAQSHANRVVEQMRKEEKKKKPVQQDDDDDDTVSDDDKKKPAKKTDDMDKLIQELKELKESFNQRVAKLEKEESKKSYQKKMAEEFKDIDPEFYQVASEGREFNSDDEFSEFVTKVKTSWGNYSQKLANEGLARMAKPKGGGTAPKEGELSKELQDRIAERSKATVSSAVKGLENVQPKN